MLGLLELLEMLLWRNRCLERLQDIRVLYLKLLRKPVLLLLLLQELLLDVRRLLLKLDGDLGSVSVWKRLLLLLELGVVVDVLLLLVEVLLVLVGTTRCAVVVH